MRFLEAALERALGTTMVRVDHATDLPGGCIHDARRLVTSEGEFFAKWSHEVPADIFLREAEGLEALRAVPSGIVIPRVIAAASPQGLDPAYLILEYLVPESRGGFAHEALGRGLAALHRARADAFGFPAASYCGLTKQDNRSMNSWPEFYRERRLRPLLSALSHQDVLSAAERQVYDRLMDRLHDLLPPTSVPSLIHGDLWAGNVLGSARGPALVDPACAYADREMEFGIATLFGGLSETALRAYDETWPLPAGWRDRNPLYQLYHLLNHAVLFGGHYGEDALRIATRYAG